MECTLLKRESRLYVLNKWEKLFKFWYICKLYLFVLYYDIVINLIQIKL